MNVEMDRWLAIKCLVPHRVQQRYVVDNSTLPEIEVMLHKSPNECVQRRSGASISCQSGNDQWMILAHYSQSESHRTTLDQTTNDRRDAIFQRGQLLSVYYTDSSSTPANYFYSALAPYFTIDTPMGQLPLSHCILSLGTDFADLWPSFVMETLTRCWIAAIWSDMSLRFKYINHAVEAGHPFSGNTWL